MKILTKSISLITIVGLLFFFSCKKETQNFDQNFEKKINTEYFGESIVTSSVGGTITDENDNGVANAQVSIGSNITTTNDNGVFLFRDISVNEKRTFVRVNKAGYFFGSRALYPSANAVSYVNIELLSTASVGSFSATSGGTINSSGVKLTFPANSVKVEGGGIYSGTVMVAAKFLDPESQDIPNQMPGDLMAVNSSNELKILETFGMAAVELTTPSGQKLNIADGKKVELSVPLSGVYLADAPANIPLWYFDEENGIWKEEGSAIKVGNNYIGEVSHFSYWNCDFPGTRVAVTGSVFCGTTPIANAKVWFYNSSGRSMGHGRTNSLGVFTGFTRANMQLTIKVYNPVVLSCNPLLYSGSVGILSSPTILPTINACSIAVGSAVLSAKLLDCSGAAITNGVLEVSWGTGGKSYYFPNSSGDVITNFIYCSLSSIDVQAYDYTNFKISPIQTITTSAIMNAGNITVCGVIDEYITYNLDGINYRIDKIPINSFGHYGTTSTIFYGYKPTSGNINLEISGNAIGTFPVNTSNFRVNSFGSLPTGNTVNATFSQYGTATGTYKIGTFSGNFIDSISTSHTLSGTFRLKNP